MVRSLRCDSLLWYQQITLPAVRLSALDLIWHRSRRAAGLSSVWIMRPLGYSGSVNTSQTSLFWIFTIWLQNPAEGQRHHPAPLDQCRAGKGVSPQTEGQTVQYSTFILLPVWIFWDHLQPVFSQKLFSFSCKESIFSFTHLCVLFQFHCG